MRPTDRCVEEDSVSKRKSSSRKSRGPRAGTGLHEIVEGGQQLISDAQERAADAAKQVQRVAADAVSTLEKRRDVELKNLRGRLKDINTAVGGLERRYRSLEKRVTKQIETISGRAVKASDLDKRIRSLEAEIRRAAGLGRSAVGGARAKKTTTTAKRRTGASAGTARKTARTATKRATGAARAASRTVSAAAKAASTTAATATKAASTGTAKGITSARRSAAGSAGGRAKAKRSTARKPATKKAPSPPSSTTSSSS
jgi:chromosome segregation ATPase